MRFPDIAAGQVIRLPSDQSCYRILWLEPSPGASYWIRLDNNENVPRSFDFEDLADGLSDGRAEYAVDTWAPSLSAGAPSAKAIQTRDRLWGSIREAAQCEPDVYEPSLRAELLRKAEQDSGIKMQNLYKVLGRYWKRGKVPDALLPDFRNCGKSRDPYSGSGRRNGRPKQEGAPGKKLTRDDLQCFLAAVQKYYLDGKKVTLSDTYGFMLTDSYSVHREGQEPELFPADEIPSFPQFRYWYYRNRDILKEVREREGERSYQLNNRAVTGRTEEVLRGPGSAGQIDATIADVFLVRQNDRSAIVGRPTLYFVKDAATRMIMGMHVTLDPPSWRSAAMAIMNTAEDKVKYCRSFGIEISPEEWPCQHLPGTILADRGEMEGSIADCLVMELGVTIENAPPYRGDLKGIIEKNFHLIDLAMTDLLPGKVKKDFGQRCTQDYRLDARLDIRQFTAIVIRCVLFYNNSHYMEYFERTPKMKQMGVLPVPREIWNFGIRYQVGVPRWVEPEKVRFSLLPKDHASITEHGISFRGMYYTCSTAVSEHWYEQARTAGVRMVTAAYDPRNAAFIYILVSQDKVPVECRLVSHNETYSGIQHAEIASEQGADRAEKAVYEYRELGAEVKLKDFIKKTIEEAEKMAPGTIKQSKAQRIASIKKNREAEMEELSSAEADRTFEKAPAAPPVPSPDSGKEVSFMTRMLRDVLNEARGRKGGPDGTGSEKS